MAVTKLPHKIQRLAGIGVTTPDAAALCPFYERTLGFWMRTAHWNARELAPALRASGIAGRISLGLGSEIIELQQFDRPGRPYPLGAAASDLCFQHFAIVVADMTTAYQRLCSVGGWSAISTEGPQRLPPSSGGVEAFKFRDPDGHPLELLAFPEHRMPQHWKARSKDELFLGIDHSAISVSDSMRSIAFYETLGLRVASRSVNSGSEQARLDGLTEPLVEVTALASAQATPHVELLCYRSDASARKLELKSNDVATTRLVFDAIRSPDAKAASLQSLIDPDGHHLVLVQSVEEDNTWNGKADALGGSPPVIVNSESAG